MERPEGEQFMFDGTLLEVVRCKHQKKFGCDCSECFAYKSSYNERHARQICNSLGVEGGYCGKIERSDKQDIVFKQVTSL